MSEQSTEHPNLEELENIIINYTVNAMVENPADLINHAAYYFTRLKRIREGLPVNFPLLNFEKNTAGRRERRHSVFGEVVEIDNTEPETYSKSTEEQRKIKSRIKDTFPFKNLDSTTVEALVDAMRPMKSREGQMIIQEGNDSTFCFVVNEGGFDVSQINELGVSEIVRHEDGNGTFGELALLHDHVRTFSLKAASDGSLWVLSRAAFTSILVKTNYGRLKRLVEFIHEVPGLRVLTEHQKLQVCDLIESFTIQEGDVLFREGDAGSGMYFIEKGTMSIQSAAKDGKQEIDRLSAGDYFGGKIVMNRILR